MRSPASTRSRSAPSAAGHRRGRHRPAELPRLTAIERAVPLLQPEERERGRMATGYLDLLHPEQVGSTGGVQDLMLTAFVPRVYERWWRPALGRAMKGLLGPSMGTSTGSPGCCSALSPGDGVLDVACGTGNFTRGFGHTVGNDGLVVGIDVSQTMLARAVQDTGPDRERGVRARRRAGAAVRGPRVRRGVLLRGAPPVRESDAGAGQDDRGAHARRADRHVHERARALGASTDAGVDRRPARRRTPLRTRELVDALKERGFGEVRQRTAGVTQFVGGTLGG